MSLCFSQKKQSPSRIPHPSSQHSPAFTLTEMLVSISVLVLLIVLVTQLLNSAVKVTSGSRNHMDADTQARIVFDRMAADFGGMLKRADVDYVFRKNTGNDKFYFYSEAPAYFSGSPATQNAISLVGYRINPSFQLERLGKGLTWDGASSGTTVPGAVVFLTYPPVAAPPAASPTPYDASRISNDTDTAGNWSSTVASGSLDTDYHVISDQVYRLEFCYILKTGSYSLTRDPAKAFRDVSAIVVTIAILDNTSRKIGAITANAVSALLDPTDTELAAAPPTVPGKKWLDTVKSSGFAGISNIPSSAAGQVRIYQRAFYLNSATDI